MTQEEKAKAYDEALERAQKATRAGSDVAMDIVQYIFPEFNESEDERIRNEILLYIGYKQDIDLDTHNRWCAYLEKQKEQKPAEWDELQSEFKNINEAFEDGKKEVVAHPRKYGLCKPAEWDDYTKTNLNRAIQIIKKAKGNLQGYQTDDGIYECDKAIEALEHFLYRGLEIEKPAEWSKEDEEALREVKLNFELNHEDMTPALVEAYERFFNKLKFFHPQPKPEWNEEDKRNLDRALFYVRDFQNFNGLTDGSKECVDWLKSLRPQPHWKLSEEQTKNFPKWKKADRDWDAGTIDFAVFHKNDGGDHEDWFSVEVTNRLYKGEYYIELSDLDKLPKEE